MALFALALQLVLSFGHVHTADLVAPAAATTQVAATQSGDRPAPAAPAKKSNGAGDICAICALIQLVSTSVTSSAPSLLTAAAARWIRWSIALDFSPALPPRLSFSARAPPLA